MSSFRFSLTSWLHDEHSEDVAIRQPNTLEVQIRPSYPYPQSNFFRIILQSRNPIAKTSPILLL